MTTGKNTPKHTAPAMTPTTRSNAETLAALNDAGLARAIESFTEGVRVTDATSDTNKVMCQWLADALIEQKRRLDAAK